MITGVQWWAMAGPGAFQAGSFGRPVTLDPALFAQPVLILEDEAMIAWTMESLLEEMGFTRIALAATGTQALETARTLRPRLIVSDINLGPTGMDGVEAVTRMTASLPDAAVVFVSGHVDADARARIGDALPGAIVAAKPIGPDELHRAIATAVAGPTLQ